MHIIGTAGHVDHGKSALVIALTGHNPDRWLEERERGMTLDLGFAPLRFDDGLEAGIIDVPGHERFLHNMLAGAAGMELLLLVIAATEGPKPQTYEHLRILNFLNVQRAIIVLTKADLVNDDELELARELVREACRGTIAQSAPIFPVSCLTGFGITQLTAAIHDQLAQLPPRQPDAPAFMPVDRVFALPGHGTIVTGTLMQGTIRTGDAIELQPSGMAARARSIQVFGRPVESATGGSRVAINLPGIDVGQIARGETLGTPRQFESVADLTIDFTPLPDAIPMLRRRTDVRAHIGSAEIPGLLIFDDGPPHDAKVKTARLALERPAVFYPGARLILRRMSPKDLLGGGTAVSALAAAAPFVAAALAQPTTASASDPILQIIRSAALTPLPIAKIAAAANAKLDAAQHAVDALRESGSVIALAKPLEYLSKDALDAAFDITSSVLRERHASVPWKLGCTAEEIAGPLKVDAALALRLLEAWFDDGKVAQRGRYWHLPDFVPTLTKEQHVLLAGLMDGTRQNPLLPKGYDEVIAAIAHSKITGAAEALESLLAVGALVRIGNDLYKKSQIERARAVLIETLSQKSGATMANVRDAFGTSRKYALPLMEYFDSAGLTIRDGDFRRLRARARAHPAAGERAEKC